MYQRVSEFNGNWADVGGDIIGDVLSNKPEIPNNYQIQRQEDEINGNCPSERTVNINVPAKSIEHQKAQNVESKDFEINIKINLKLNILTE